MSLMAVVTTIFTTAVLTMYRTSNNVETSAEAQGRILTAFYRLEREIRYAEQINPPRRTAGLGHYIVDYVIKDAENVRQCVQLVLPAQGGDFRRRQWPLGEQPEAPSSVIASGLRIGPVDAAHPSPTAFVVHGAGTNGSDFDRLIVYLATDGEARAAGAPQLYELQFTALNTVQEGARAPANGCAPGSTP